MESKLPKGSLFWEFWPTLPKYWWSQCRLIPVLCSLCLWKPGSSSTRQRSRFADILFHLASAKWRELYLTLFLIWHSNPKGSQVHFPKLAINSLLAFTLFSLVCEHPNWGNACRGHSSTLRQTTKNRIPQRTLSVFSVPPPRANYSSSAEILQILSQ